MARKITSGTVGRQVLGSIVIEDSTLNGLVSGNIVLQPINGNVVSTSNVEISNNGSLVLKETAANGTNSINLKAPASMTADVTYTLPAAATNNYFMKTDASGNLSWSQAFIVNDDNPAATGSYSIMLTNVGDGNITSTLTASSKLSIVPSSGLLSATAISTGNLGASGTSTLTTVDINGGNIDGTTIGSASAAAGTFTTLTATSITETSSIALKENVSPITNALDAIMQLVGVTYDRKDGSSKNEAGLIKEEVEKVLPNLVKDDGIHYTKLTAYLIEAVKELTEEIKILKGKS